MVTGRLIDEDGQPLAGAKLSVWTFDLDGNNLPQGDSGAMWPNNATFTADADGRFPGRRGWSSASSRAWGSTRRPAPTSASTPARPSGTSPSGRAKFATSVT